MIVYVDILIVLNLIVNYFLLSATGKILKRKALFIRLFTGAFLGAIFSLYIFLPQSPLAVEFLLRLLLCFAVSFTVFGFLNFKEYLKVTAVFFGITCLYAGSLWAVWRVFKPKGMVVNNSVVYFDISAVALIVCTVFFYFVFVAFSKIFASNAETAERCDMVVTANGNKAEFTAILDTGNSLTDVFGNSEVIISDKKTVLQLFGTTDTAEKPELRKRYRIIPLNTVSGADMLEGFRCDTATAKLDGETVIIKNPILAISKTVFDSGYNAIINPKIFRNAVQENVSKNEKSYK